MSPFIVALVKNDKANEIISLNYYKKYIIIFFTKYGVVDPTNGPMQHCGI